MSEELNISEQERVTLGQTLAKVLLQSKPRENSGSRTSLRFRFQKELSLFLLLEYHRNGTDYVFLFDFHDDLLVLDSDSNPSKIDAYQIKTKDRGNWTLRDLLRRKNNNDLSYLGKLYSNCISFSNIPTNLHFISNARYSFSLADGSSCHNKVRVKGTELDQDSINQVNTQLIAEHSLSNNPRFENVTSFEVTKLSLDDCSTHCKGALHDLLEELNSGNKVKLELAYRKIQNEITIKTDFVSDTIQYESLQELIAKKGLSREQFIQILSFAGLYKSSEDQWSEIQNSLQLNNVGHLTLRKLKRGWQSFNALILDKPGNIILQRTIEFINGVVEKIDQEKDSENLPISELLKIISEKCTPLPYELDEYIVKAIILKRLYDS